MSVWRRMALSIGVSLLVVDEGSCLAQSDGLPQSPRRTEPAVERAADAVNAGDGPSDPSSGFPGVFLLGQAVELTSPVDARVNSIEVRMGDIVRRDQVVAQLDTGQLSGELAIAAAQHAVARAEVERMRLELREAGRVLANRTKLWREKLIAHDDLELAKHRRRQAKCDLQVARARSAEAKARVEGVRRRLHDSTILAPFDGVVGERYAEPGATIGPAKPILRLISTSVPRVRFAVPAEFASRVASGLAARVSLLGAEVLLVGVVTHVAPELDLASRMLFAEVELDAPPPGATPLGGRSVRVHLEAARP